jgi:hypothetical protein
MILNVETQHFVSSDNNDVHETQSIASLRQKIDKFVTTNYERR